MKINIIKTHSASANHSLVKTLLGLSFLIMLAGTVIRPIITDLPLVFTVLGTVNLVLISIAFMIVRSCRFPDFDVPILIACGMLAIVPLLFISGGVLSQFAFFLPLFPVITAMLGDRKETIGIALIVVLLIAGMLFKADIIEDFTGDKRAIDKTLSAGLWLILATISGTCVGIIYQRRTRMLREQLESLAERDPLTGVLNRRGFYSRMTAELSRAIRDHQPLCLLLLDIDHFKRINDQFGHDAGDKCLVNVVNCLNRLLRKSDIISRFGGEEFIVVLPNSSLKMSTVLAERLRSCVAYHGDPDFPVAITMTIGVAFFDGEESLNALIKRADVAMYEGKATGRNKVVIAPSSAEKITK